MERGEWPASHPGRFVLGKYPAIYCIGLNWLITWKGWQEAISSMGINNLNLRSSQVRKMEKLVSTRDFNFFKYFHHQNNRLKIFLLFSPLQISSNKENILRYKNMGGESAPLALSTLRL